MSQPETVKPIVYWHELPEEVKKRIIRSLRIIRSSQGSILRLRWFLWVESQEHKLKSEEVCTKFVTTCNNHR